MNLGTLNAAGDRFVFSERVCRTEDDRLVVEGHQDARWLFAIPGEEITTARAMTLGLVDSVETVEGEGGPVPTGSAAAILEWVAGDAARAQAALEVEASNPKPRKALSAELAAIVAAAGGEEE